ncbi:MAG: Crp/Fnr family transcriptional regulator [Chryseobacterium sp.]|uniref:Crp/Fnr family transcriptional regulator n=1 Tax=Chryseobacterium carnipullorum TaxID=1124835 RepID=UPI000917AEAD|nr:Crp/Fnr family transcriptional regulator [Chryseobacterium carnipullorum]MDN5477966.1 Crp/Fnr family transcriptional regulator [Chryseobacterium sp.]SHM52444.1 cAMP-binding domain of CRP or a regulatory subunit of cAMP-dependent protein kinases [Chryseobacterium carnipullorum]
MIQKLLNSGLHWREKEFKRNEFLKMAGSTDTDIYFIDKGSIRIYMMDENEERIIRFGYTGNIIVSLDSFLSGKPSGFYMQAIRKTLVRIASKKDFYEFIHSNEENLKFWNSVLEDLVLQQIEREKDLLINSPRERFNRVLKRSPKLFQEVPNKYIANYLRMSPETLSRLKKS